MEHRGVAERRASRPSPLPAAPSSFQRLGPGCGSRQKESHRSCGSVSLKEVHTMHKPVTLRGRTQVAALLHRVEQEADQGMLYRGVDGRNVRTWRQAIVGVWVTHSLRLLVLGRVLAPLRRAQSVKAAAQGLAYFLTTAQFPHVALSTNLLEAAVGQLDPRQLVLYQGKALVALDPTEYGKRSRGRG